MKIIVLSITPYKEKDGIVNAISENESLTFLARGIKDPKSKNAALNNVLTVADIELMDGNFTHPILKSSKPLFSPLKVDMDAKY
jgi:recombinational DNA repair protein (RecF pathway)